ncbi:MAG: hypothetical protein K1X47_16770 [Cyclobacteriaceae bacterium]|nr:hypothetical protein [Cyclobacteriaceae bacterium]
MVSAILYLISLAGFVSAGYIFAHYRYQRKSRSWKLSGTENAIIGFYGLILSFLLLMAGNANKERYALIHQHADAIASLHREAGLLPAPARDTLRQHVIRLLESRLETDAEEDDDRREVLLANTSGYDQMWSTVEHFSLQDTLSPKMRPVIQAAQQAIALNYRIAYSNREGTPLTLMALLIVGSWLVGFLVGFTNGFNAEHSFLVPVIFFIITGLTVLTIRDLNDPNAGLIKPSLDNYREMLQAIRPSSR